MQAGCGVLAQHVFLDQPLHEAAQRREMHLLRRGCLVLLRCLPVAHGPAADLAVAGRQECARRPSVKLDCVGRPANDADIQQPVSYCGVVDPGVYLLVSHALSLSSQLRGIHPFAPRLPQVTALCAYQGRSDSPGLSALRAESKVLSPQPGVPCRAAGHDCLQSGMPAV